MVVYNFAKLHNRGEDWMARQYVMRAQLAAQYARSAHRILDIASGSGYCTYHIACANPQAEVVGVDVSQAAVEYANRRYKAENLRFETGDGFNLKYATGYFDLVVCYETLEHITNGDDFIKELSRVCNQNGHLLISTPNLEFDFPNKEHIKVYEKVEFFSLLRKYFKEVKENYQYQTNSDRGEELAKIRMRRMQRIYLFPLNVACMITPRVVKNAIKVLLGKETNGSDIKPYLIKRGQIYPAETVMIEPYRTDACTYILFGICSGTLHK